MQNGKRKQNINESIEPNTGKKSTENNANTERANAPKHFKTVNVFTDAFKQGLPGRVYYWHDGDKIPYFMPRGKVIKLKHNGEFYEYETVYCGFDIETTNIEANEKHLAFMYHWQFSISTEESAAVFMGRTWLEFFDFIEQLKQRYDLSDNRRIIVWIANAGFEFQFIRKYMQWDPDDFFAREERHPMKMRSCGLEFHEALTISGGSLAQLAKDYTVTQKLAGDLDYDIPRNSKTQLTDQEKDYCINDVVILSEWSKFIFDNYIKPDKRIPLTKTGILRSETRLCLQNTAGQGGLKTYRSLIYEAFPDPETYEKWFKYLFRGGYVHSNCLMTGFEIPEVDGYDITSSYPKEMLIEPEYPLTPFVKTQFNAKDLQEKCCIMLVRFKNIRRKWAHSIESKSKAVQLDGSEKMKIVIDNGRIAQAAALKVWITNLDFDMYKLFYNWDGEPEIIEFWTSEKGYLPLFIRKTLAKYYKLKAQLKRDGKQDTPEYKIAKAKVNSFFGMMCTRMELSKILYDNNAQAWQVLDKELDFYDEIKSQFLLPQWGIFVTALARKSLLSVTAAITSVIGDGSGDNGAGVIYNDTDSIKVFDPDGIAAKIIDEYNEKVRAKRVKARLVSEEFAELGEFDHEAHYKRFKTLGAKRYLVEENGKYKATIAGLPKQSILNIQGDPFRQFDLDGMLLDADVSLKKTISYNDSHTEAIVDGELMQEESSAGIYDISFTMNLEKAYYTLVTAGLTERIRKYGD